MTVRLALDTATERASVAVSVNGALTAELGLGPRRAAAGLLPGIHAVLERSGAGISDVTDVVVANGPGSFTGLRIGFSTVAGLVEDRDVAVWTAPSLAGLASGALAGEDGSVLALYDALRGDVYAAEYALESGVLVERIPPRMLPLEEALALVRGPETSILGDGALRHAERLQELAQRRVAPGEAHFPRAAGLLDAARMKRVTVRVEDLSAFVPDYGRQAEAQVRWEAEHGRTLPDSARPTG